jgi:hypothetical protein
MRIVARAGGAPGTHVRNMVTARFQNRQAGFGRDVHHLRIGPFMQTLNPEIAQVRLVPAQRITDDLVGLGNALGPLNLTPAYIPAKTLFRQNSILKSCRIIISMNLSCMSKSSSVTHCVLTLHVIYQFFQ